MKSQPNPDWVNAPYESHGIWLNKKTGQFEEIEAKADGIWKYVKDGSLVFVSNKQPENNSPNNEV